MERPFPFEGFQMLEESLGPELFVFERKGHLRRGTGQVGPYHVGVVGVQDCRLKGPFKEVVRVFHKILVQGVRFCHEDHHRFPP